MAAYDKETRDAVALLKKLIATPSFSREEAGTAGALEFWFHQQNIPCNRSKNNVWARNRHFTEGKPTLLLNSHHDTVKPNPGYTRDPFKADEEGDLLYGLGSTDAGGAAVSLLITFRHFYEREDLPFNLVVAITAEEEVSGTNGVEAVWPELPPISFAIVGEPTLTQVAIAEKGLMVLDCVSRGKAGHAARNEGDNAIYRALPDIEWFRTYSFPDVSETLGPVKMSVTIIQAGQAHNQVPPECKFTVDVRVTDKYTLEQVLETVRKSVSCEVTPRSMRIRPSGIPIDHVLARAARKIGKELYGSPTTSDRALIPVPSIKMGPGDSGRSHSANEYIHISEIQQGISAYITLLEAMREMM